MQLHRHSHAAIFGNGWFTHYLNIKVCCQKNEFLNSSQTSAPTSQPICPLSSRTPLRISVMASFMEFSGIPLMASGSSGSSFRLAFTSLLGRFFSGRSTEVLVISLATNRFSSGCPPDERSPRLLPGSAYWLQEPGVQGGTVLIGNTIGQHITVACAWFPPFKRHGS